MAKQPTCEERIVAERRGREEWLALYFADLDNLDPEEIVALAIAHDDEVDFELTDREKTLVEWGKEGVDEHDELNEPYPDSDGEPSTRGEQYDLLVELARTALEQFRDEHPEPDVLGVETTVSMKIQLSWGGPADFLTCEVDMEDRSIGDVEYHFQDWFDGARRSVDSDSPLYTLCERFAEVVQLPGGRE